MTATRAPEPTGFVSTLATHTANAFWAHYDKAITAAVAAVFGYGMVWGTAWLGALPQPPAPKAPTEAVRLPALDTQLAGRLDTLDAAIKALRADVGATRAEVAAARADIAAARAERAKRPTPPPTPK